MAISKKKGSPYYYTRFSLCGIRVQESTKCTARGEAEEYEEKRRREIREHVKLGKKPSYTWPQAVMRWIDEKSHKKSFEVDLMHLKWLQDHLNNYELKSITKDVVEAVVKQKESEGEYQPSYINKMLSIMRAILNRAHRDWEWIDKVPKITMRPEGNTRIRWLTRNEADRLLKELPAHLQLMMRFTLATGLRSANVRGLKWADVDLVRRHAMVAAENSKNGRAIAVPLNDDAIEIIKSQMGKHTTYVFTYNGQYVSQCSTRAWRNALARAGIVDFHWHDLRHTWASWHVQSGTTLQELYDLGGWKKFDMVLRYAHLSSSHLRAAADRISGKKGKAKLKVV